MRNIISGGLLLAAALMLGSSLKAQSLGPKAGDVSVAVKLGRGISFYDLNAYEVNRNASYSNTLPALAAPNAASYSTSNSATNMVGVELKYHLADNLAVRLGGGGALQSTPAKDALSGVEDPSGENYPGTVIPGYEMQEGINVRQAYGDLGVDYYISTGSPRLHPFAGVQANVSYASIEIYDGFRGLDTNGEVIPTLDTRKGETYALGGSLVAGVDYYLAEGFFLGLEFKAFNYMYAAKKVYPQTGMAPQTADNHNLLFLSQPVLRLGFSF